MPRPCKQRRVGHDPRARLFKPQGVPLKDLEGLTLGLDQLEAMRLADLEGLKLEEVGEKMGVSRATAGRIVEAAHRIVARALVEGRALSIGGGPVVRCGPGKRGPGKRGHGQGKGGGCGGGRERARGRGGCNHEHQGEEDA